MEFIDISRSVSPTTAVWPGDRPVEWEWSARIEEGDAVNVGALCMSMHTGSHVDAPYHVAEEGARTEELPLSAFMGNAILVEVGSEASVCPNALPSPPHADRILFKTPSSEVPDEEWEEDILPFDPETISLLREREAVLIGTDAPSVDPLDSKTLPAHHALRSTGLVHLEGLCFNGVRPGRYTLLALPLKIPRADAAPVRAVLAPPDVLSVR